jgi:hypothetical protein
VRTFTERILTRVDTRPAHEKAVAA